MKTSALFLALSLLGASLASAQSRSTIANLSSRGSVGQTSGSLLAGFVVSGTTPKTVLVRGVGPGLGEFNVPNPASGVGVWLLDASGNVVASNTGYQTDPNAAAVMTVSNSVGAFPISNPGDSATVATLPPGDYSVTVAATDPNAPDGAALLEVYDADAPGSGSAIVNLSTRGQIAATAGPLVSGFVVSGSAPKALLVRSVGPDLANFGISNAAAGVGFVIYDSNGNLVSTGVGMGTSAAAGTIAADATQLGAFPLSGDGDSATVVTLAPGAYTISAVSTSGTNGGMGLLEVYDADSLTTPSQTSPTNQ